MIKKIFLITLIISSVFMAADCSDYSRNPADPGRFLITEGVALTCDMDELAENEEYLALISPSGSIRPVIDKMAAQDYSMPENAYVIKMTDDILLKLINSFSGETNISKETMERLKYKINGSIFANMINASYGSDIIAAAAMTTWGKSYIQPEGWSDNVMLIFEYPGEFSSVVSFIKSGDGVISGSSVFIKNGDIDVLTLLNKYSGMVNIKYDRYTNSELRELLAK